MNKSNIILSVKKNKIIAIIRGENKDEAIKIAERCYQNKIRNIEITFTNPEAVDIIKGIKKKYVHDEILLGAGTILDSVSARIAILAGADFIVGPSFKKEIAKVCNIYQKPYIPGCSTPTEIINAMEYGVEIVKLFPSSFYGPDYIKALKAPLPQISFMATGGINLDNFGDWLNAGADIIGVGSALTKNEEMVDINADLFIEILEKK